MRVEPAHPAPGDLAHPALRAQLLAWLARHVPAMAAAGQAAHWQLQRLPGGQSNPTWVLAAGAGTGAAGAAQRWVLRAKPAPVATLLPSAHAIEREVRVLRALAGSAVPVPPVAALCEDESVIGVAFYVMDHVDGRIPRDSTLPGLTPAARAAHYAEAADVLARLHAVDWQARGLGDFGRRDGYLQRQIQRWQRQYDASLSLPGLDAHPAMRALARWLPQHLPPPEQAARLALVHGDFRLENLVFHPQAPRVLAVLDWELSTLGHPWMDLAYHAMAWHHPGGLLRGIADADLHALGLPDEAAMVERYLEASGAGAADGQALRAHWPFYLALNHFRLAAILTGIARRVLDGTAAHPQAREIAAQAGPVAERGWALAQRA